MNTLFKYKNSPPLNQHCLVLFDLEIRLNQVQPLWVRVDPGVMTMRGYSSFPALLESHYQIIKCNIQLTR